MTRTLWILIAALVVGLGCTVCDDDDAADDDDATDPGDDDATADDDTADDDATADDDTADDDDTTDPASPPANFVRVGADPDVGTVEDFYVAKYEMKIVGHDDGDQPEYDDSWVAESRPSGIPWQWLNLDQAAAECEALGTGFALLTNEEWMTIARSIEANPANWSDGQAHPSGTPDATLNIGHTCRVGAMGSQCRMDQFPYSGEGLPASIDDEEGCYGYVQGQGELGPPALDDDGWNLYRRTFFLENGEVIWDFAGNVWEWVDWFVPLAADRARYGNEINDDYLEVNLCDPTEAMPSESFQSANLDLNGVINAHGVGRYHPTTVDHDAGAAMRGGNFMHSAANNGIYALGMGYCPDTDHILCRIGFRCAWHPQAE